MNKNPFLPQLTYNSPQPPLPPGPPPQPAADYQHHWPGYPPAQYTSQWTPPTTARPGEQNPLFANYGYGPQNQWQRQQQQPQHYHPPPPPVVQPPPQPPVAAAPYNPYQPAVTYPYPHPAPQGMAQPQFTQPQQPIFAPHIPPQPMQMTQQPPVRMGQPSAQQQPPAKRPRYDGPNQNQNRSQPFQPPNQPHQGSGGRGGGPGSNQVPLGSGNRGGAGGSRGNLGGGGRGRGGGSMNSGRGGGMPGRTGRGGSTYNIGGGNSGRGGSTSGSMRSHGSRGHLGSGKDFHNRRGPGSSFAGGSGSYGQGSGSFRSGRNQGHSNSNRSQRHETSANILGLKDSSSSSLGSSKRDERRRTLTDFKIVGLEIPELSWTWGTLPRKPSSSDPAMKTEDVEIKVEDTSQSSLPQSGPQILVKTETVDDASALTEPNADIPGSDGPGDDNASVTTEVANTTLDVATASYASMESSKDTSSHIPHSRIRIYFHTPVSVDDSHSAFALGSIPSDSRKGKRKKLDDDDDDGDVEEGRAPPPPAGDRSNSVAPSVTETAASEADWLMAAIVEGEDNQKAPVNGEDDGDDGERQHISEIVEPHDAMSDVDTVEQNVSQGKENEVQSNAAVTSDPPGLGKESASGGTDVPMDATVAPAQNGPVDKATESMSSTVPSVPHFTFSFNDAIPSDSSNSAEAVQEKQAEPVEMQSAIEPPEIQTQTETQVETQHTDSFSFFQPSQTNETEHLPEPPASPTSNTFLSTSSSSTFGENTSQHSTSDKKPSRTPSANRISISYAGGDRRLIIDSEICNGVKIFRGEGRIEIQIKLQSDEEGLVGLSMESLSDTNKTFTPVDKLPNDPVLLPPFASASSPNLTLIVYLDTERPLSEARWLKTGDIQDWLRSMFGKAPPLGGASGNGWERKITVVDPDPPPTIWTVLDSWAMNSPVGNGPTERQRFVKTHLSETENLLEILLRLVRGERATAFQSAATISNSSVSGPLLTALDQGTAHGPQQTHVSLAVLAIFQMTLEYATKAIGAGAKKEVENRVGEIIRCLPSHLTYKSLDGMFKEWKAEKKGQGR
ncbi:hypothetical protein L218DRAFT_980084 [Marasmius fiardii PR-910]|nr:hypothetical protein L218DRAFT_980084 [Marasmius fiardii PR-910]